MADATAPVSSTDERLVRVSPLARLVTRPDIGALLGAVAVYLLFAYTARAVGWATTRNDIDEKDFVPAGQIPTPGADYFDVSDWNFVTTTTEKVRLRLKELLGQRDK